MTRKFGGGSVKSLEDFYENSQDVNELVKENFGVLEDNATLDIPKDFGPVVDGEHFSFSVSNLRGVDSRVPVKVVANQLRLIAKFLEETPRLNDKKILFKVAVWEQPHKPLPTIVYTPKKDSGQDV